VRAKYASAATAATSGGACCVPADEAGLFGASLYAETGESGAPDAAITASLGCGVPTAVADLHEGETVLDLGSGAGADVVISARRVGPTGKAIGLDMTDEMLEVARANAAEAGLENVEFVKGYLEDMPLDDETVDVVISNCVINLSGDKPRVIREAARVLRPGGRFAVSDVIADPDMDEQTRADMAAWTGCIAGALTETEFRAALADAGLGVVEIRETHRVHEHAGAAIIRARKPMEANARPAGCELSEAGLGAQLQRYRRLAEHVTTLERTSGKVIAEFAQDLPQDLLETTLEVERRCCPFIEATYEPRPRRLTLAVQTSDEDPGLDPLFNALAPPRSA
jgi:ubiquinone/menaquinone biosynthesis C-methylase UbiE